MVSHIFTWFHTFSLGFTCFHMVSHIFTWFHMFSLGFTHFHLISHIFTLVSHVFTYFHMFSRCEKVWKSVRWITSKNEKKNFPPGRGPGFSLIFMKKIFPQNREDMSKKGSKKKFSRSARKGPFISRKYVMTWDGNVHQEPNQPFSHVFPRQALALGSL